MLDLRIRDPLDSGRLLWVTRGPLSQLSCKLEGQALGGGGLKLEPGETGRIALPDMMTLIRLDDGAIRESVSILQRWRHYDEPDAIYRAEHHRVVSEWSELGSIVGQQRPVRRRRPIDPNNVVIRTAKQSLASVSAGSNEAAIIVFEPVNICSG